MARNSIIFAGAMAALALPLAAIAQAPPNNKAPVAPKADQADSTKCAPSDARSTVGKGEPGGDQKSSSGGSNLSDKLAKSNGVICPPDQTDPEIKAPTPPGGSMPVIPPPGSPGGDPSVQPK